MPPKSKEIKFSGARISWAHTAVAYTAFLGALITGLYLHYHKIVENEYYVCHQPSKRSLASFELTHCLRATRMNGSLRSLPLLETDIQSVQSFSSSLP